MSEDWSEDCLQFEERINDLIDSRSSLADDIELNRHAADCAQCDRLLQDYLQILGPGIAREPQPSAFVSASTFTELPAKPRTPQQFRQAQGNWKVVLGLAPSFGALLIVSISIWLSANSSPTASIGSPPNWNAVQAVVAQNTILETQDLTAHPDWGHSNEMSHPLSNSLLTQAGMIDGVQECSAAFYQLANDHSPLQTYRLVQHNVVNQVALPHQPLHHQVPYHGEFSAIPQLRFFVGFAVRLIQLAFSNNLSDPSDLGLFLEPWMNSRCV